MHKIFISYSRSDYSTVVKLKSEIEKLLGKQTCWIDLTGIESDSQFVEVIIDAINKAEIFLFMHSTHSEQSDWTRKEIMYANGKGKKIVIVKIDRTPLSDYFAFQFAGHDIIDLSDKKQKNKLMNDLVNWCVPGSKPNSQVNPRIDPNLKYKTFAREKVNMDLYPRDFLKELRNDGVELFNAMRKVVSQKSLVKAFVLLALIWVPASLGANVLIFMALAGGYYIYKGTILEKFPKCRDHLRRVEHYGMKILMALNIILSVLFLSVACTKFDPVFNFASWGMLMLSIVLVILKLVDLNKMGKKEVLVSLVLPICIYLVTVIVFQVQKYKNGYFEKIERAEKIFSV